MDFTTVTPPAAAGMNPERIAELQQRASAQVRDGRALGMQVVVARHGQVVVDAALGAARRNPPAPVTAETLFYSWSVAKPITAMAVHLLIERGTLSLDTPIAEVWPAFAQEGKEAATVGHALSHRAGVPLTPPSLAWHQYASWTASVDAIAASHLSFQPGSAVQYHSLTFGWVLGEIVRRVDGRPIETFAREEFFIPLGMLHSTLKLPESLLTQTAELAASADFPDGMQAIQAWNLPLMRQAVIPAAGLHSTARDLARFYQMLLNDGELEGRCVLAPESIARARKPSTLPGEREQDTNELSHRAFGFSLGGHAQSLWGGEASGPTTFGHNGWATNASFADPERGLVCIILNNLMLDDEANNRRLRALTDLVFAACE
ncbi:MAG: beta-lactamase family protein [Chloroflexi bacterium]|nr:beta-lactamase family protein [Chloroflexota bacterium]